MMCWNTQRTPGGSHGKVRGCSRISPIGMGRHQPQRRLSRTTSATPGPIDRRWQAIEASVRAKLLRARVAALRNGNAFDAPSLKAPIASGRGKGVDDESVKHPQPTMVRQIQSLDRSALYRVTYGL